MKFGRYQGNYNNFKEQFQSAQLSPFKNEWASIHDFTPIGDLENWSVMSQEEKVSERSGEGREERQIMGEGRGVEVRRRGGGREG